MPEGPECRRYAMDLAERVSNRTLLSVEMVSGRYTKKPPTGIDSFTSHLPCKIVGAGVHRYPRRPSIIEYDLGMCNLPTTLELPSWSVSK